MATVELGRNDTKGSSNVEECNSEIKVQVEPDKFSRSFSEAIQKDLKNKVRKDKAILTRFGIISQNRG